MGALRTVSVSLALILGAGVSAARAQAPPVVTASVERSPIRAGELLTIVLDVVVAADTNGTQATATIDPISAAANTFVIRMSHVGFVCRPSGCGPCPAGRQCLSQSIAINYRVRGLQTFPITIVDAKRRETRTSVSFDVQPPEDADGDGLPDSWEIDYGLDSRATAGDDGASGDPDRDGVTNLEEFARDSSPRARYVQYFAEMSTGDRQKLWSYVSAYQPEHKRGSTQVRLFGDGGRTATFVSDHIFAGGSLNGIEFPADRVVLATIESGERLVAERTSTLGAQYAIVNVSPAIAAPSRTWYFAEGGSGGALDLFLLTYNPNPAPVTAEFTYLRSPGQAPIVRERVLLPGVRTTIWTNVDDPELAGADVAPMIRTSAPILVERAWRVSPPGKTIPHETASPGATRPANSWYFPQLLPGSAFESALVVANPNEREADVDVTSYFADREPVMRRFRAPAMSRIALSARDVAAGGAEEVSVRLTSSAGLPVIVERSLTGRGAAWRQASLGATAAGTRWAFSYAGLGAAVHDPANHALTLANTTDVEARVELHFYTDYFEPTTVKAIVTVPPRRRLRLTSTPGVATGGSGGLVVTSLPRAEGSATPIVAEYTRYSQLDGDPRVASLIGVPIP
jgi:hypothetical protein